MKIFLTVCTLIIFFMFGELKVQDKTTDNFTEFAQYKLSYKIDSLQKEPTIEYFALMLNQSMSGFRSAANYILDSIKNTVTYKDKPQMERVAMGSKYRSNFEEYILINLAKKEITYTTKVFLSIPNATSPQYTEQIIPKWLISKETKKIKNILCTKAETTLFGRKWIAWYSNEHPFPFGPYKFYGLPGLIVNIADTTGSYIYELHNFKQKLIEYPRTIHENIVKVSKAKSIEMYNTSRYTNVMFKDIKEEGSGPDQMKRMQEVFDKKKKMENNPLELVPN